MRAHPVAEPTYLGGSAVFEHSEKESHTNESTGVELDDWGLKIVLSGATRGSISRHFTAIGRQQLGTNIPDDRTTYYPARIVRLFLRISIGGPWFDRNLGLSAMAQPWPET